jgi:hypothetical protein
MIGVYCHRSLQASLLNGRRRVDSGTRRESRGCIGELRMQLADAGSGGEVPRYQRDALPPGCELVRGQVGGS